MKASTIDRLREWGITLLRVGTGTAFLVHEGVVLFFMGFSLSLQAAVESLLGATLLLGLFTRWVSMILAIGMVVDILLIHLPNSFLAVDVSLEYALLRLTASLTLVLAGPGRAALGNIRALQRVPVLSRLQR